MIVADNGSTDGSQEIAASLGARVVAVKQRGYGSALMGGIAAARGRYVIMGDADDSYDFLELPKFVDKLREGYDLVQGCRLERGGGTVAPGAMPALHRRLGQPDVLGDGAHVVPRADQRRVLRPARLHQGALRVAEPALHGHGVRHRDDHQVQPSRGADRRGADHAAPGRPQGPRAPPAHLPRRLAHAPLLPALQPPLAVPGARASASSCSGCSGTRLALPRVEAFGVVFDAHTLLFASLAIICGYQSAVFAVFTKVFAVSEGLMPPDPRLQRLGRVVTLERGLIASAVCMVGGLVLLALAVNKWRVAGLRRSRLLEHHAAGRARRHPDGAGLPDDALQLLRERPRDAAPLKADGRIRHPERGGVRRVRR